MYLKPCLQMFPAVTSSLRTASIFKSLQVSPSLITISRKYDIRHKSSKPQRTIKEVYHGVLTPQIKAVKIFSLSSSIVGVIAQPFLYKEIFATSNVPIILAAYSFIGFFTVVTPILLHLITKKYIIQLNYNKETNTYIAKTVNFFCIPKETEFTPEDVKVPDVPGMFTTFSAKGKSFFVDPRLFEQPEHYSKIMGYDKPIDFKLYETSDNDKKVQ
ncbi:transmembrane protein 70 homolog, mitochondrial [Leptinotarsa decemlineata]|uniref:transmembrane protein 70 homolog, mitochondrial n=1 Tax=Leptinotarsa decemlineata TaxID=7539 RepID=UPI003D30CCB8